MLGFIPGIPNITLDPDLIFLVVLPPLLYAAAWTTSWRDFRYNLVSIFLLAFGLVGFTVLAVALIAPRVFDGFDWRLGFVLGAVVAPTDAIAATSIARRVGLPGRIVDILEGESLINDATGLLALQFATGHCGRRSACRPVAAGILTFAWLIVAALDWACSSAGWSTTSSGSINDGPIEITLSILVPYAVYLAAAEGSCIGRAGGCRVWTVSLPPQRQLFLTLGSHPDLVRLGVAEFCAEWVGLRPHWTSASGDSRIHPRIYDLSTLIIGRRGL